MTFRSVSRDIDAPSRLFLFLFLILLLTSQLGITQNVKHWFTVSRWFLKTIFMDLSIINCIQSNCLEHCCAQWYVVFFSGRVPHIMLWFTLMTYIRIQEQNYDTYVGGERTLRMLLSGYVNFWIWNAAWLTVSQTTLIITPPDKIWPADVCFFSYRDALKEQPKYSLLPEPYNKMVPAVLFTVGQIFVVTSTWALGITGTFLGDYFGILMDHRVEGFPFNVLRDPMYVGSTMCFAAAALW